MVPKQKAIESPGPILRRGQHLAQPPLRKDLSGASATSLVAARRGPATTRMTRSADTATACHAAVISPSTGEVNRLVTVCIREGVSALLIRMLTSMVFLGRYMVTRQQLRRR